MRARLGIEPLEDRVTPAVSPADVGAAFATVSADTAVLQRVVPLVQRGTNQYTKATLNGMLPDMTTRLEQAAATLTRYQNELIDQVRAGDSGATPTLARVAQGRFAAETAAAFSSSATAAFGGPATTAPVARPVGDPLAPIGVPEVFFNRADDAGLTAQMPDLTSPDFRDVGQGLAVKEVNPGFGQEYTGSGTLKVYYTGFLIDQTKFDGNVGTGKPLDLSSGAIKGFTLGLVGLKPGGIRILNIPAELGYGANVQGNIPANSRLIFEVKLLDPNVTIPGATGTATSGTGTGTATTNAPTTGTTTTGTTTTGTSVSGGTSGSGGVSSGSTGLTGTTSTGTTGTGTGSTTTTGTTTGGTGVGGTSGSGTTTTTTGTTTGTGTTGTGTTGTGTTTA